MGEKLFKVVLAVLIQYRRVTDSQPARHPRCRSAFTTSPGSTCSKAQ